MEISRSDIVVAVLPGDYGKSRPPVVVQSVVCPITTHVVDAPLFRVTLSPSASTGLKAASQIMVDKMMAVKRERIAQVIGRLDVPIMQEVDRALQAWLEIP